MMFFTVTNIRKKGSLALKLALVIVLVAVLLPYVHGMMLEVNAMEEMQTPLPEENLPNQEENSANANEQQLAQAELGELGLLGEAEAEEAEAEADPEAAADGPLEEEYPGEPVRVDGELWLPLTFWQEVATGLSY